MKLRQLRQARNMSIGELASKAGVAYKMVAYIEEGATTPRRIEVMRRLAAALEVPPQLIDEFQYKVGTPEILTLISREMP